MKEIEPGEMPNWIKWIHAGLAIFGITAYLTGEWAEESQGWGYLLHAYLGLTLLLFLVGRLGYGFLGQSTYRFKNWFPYRSDYLITIKEDWQELLQFKLPERQDHRGLAGLVQAFGLILFLWMAVTGTIIFFIGSSDDSTLSELHEVGEGLIPLYLVLHIGAVLIHSLFGHKVLAKIIPFLAK